MNRRKPPTRLAFIPVEPGMDRRQAVLRKAAQDALLDVPRIPPTLLPFAAGFLAGAARQEALRHGVDAEEEGADSMAPLLEDLRALAPEAVAQHVVELRLLPRAGPSRASLRAEPGLADAGYLAGHLAALCRAPKLFGMALEALGRKDVEAFFAACDQAADRLQTHQPTMALRFDSGEREMLRAALC